MTRSVRLIEGHIVIRPKPLRIIGSCLAAFAVLFEICAVSFDIFIAPIEEGISLLFFIIVLLNLVQATLLFMWAAIVERRN